MMIDEILLMIIVAGIGLSIAYFRAEYVLHRAIKAAEHKKLIVQHELHASRLTIRQIDVPRDGAAQGACMTSMSTRCLELSGAHRLFVLLLAITMLTACHPGAGSLGGGCLVCGSPTQVNLEGTL